MVIQIINLANIKWTCVSVVVTNLPYYRFEIIIKYSKNLAQF